MFVELNDWQLADVGLPPRAAFEDHVTSSDRTTLRDLARRVSDIGHLPVMSERRALWKRHNALQRVRPMPLVFPEGAWRELLPGSTMRCEGNRAGACEWALRQAIYQHAHLRVTPGTH